MDSPRTTIERQTFQERNQIRLEYPPERAPTQYQIQKRTSELSLTVPTAVESLTPIQLAADRVAQLRLQPKPKSQKAFSILDEAEVKLESF